MNTYERALREVCGSEDRFRLLAFLFSHPGSSFHVRGLAQEADVDPTNASRLLLRFVEAGLCTRSVEGVYVRYEARRDHPLFALLVELFSQAGSVMNELRTAAGKVPGTVLVFGSYARGEDRPDSDIDVLVINDEPSIVMGACFKPVGRRLKREIQVTTAPVAEIVEALRQGSDFWHEVFANQVRVIRGEVPDAIHRAVAGGRLEVVRATASRSRQATKPHRARAENVTTVSRPRRA